MSKEETPYQITSTAMHSSTSTAMHSEPMKGYVEAMSDTSEQYIYTKTSYFPEQAHQTYYTVTQPPVTYLDHDIVLSIRKAEEANDARVINMIERTVLVALVVLGFMADYRFISWLLSLIK